jgi:DNA repair protein RecO (recombination protein O)
MNDKLDVVVLHQQDYRENDALVFVISKDKGYRTFLAKGLRKLESKNSYACQPFSIANFSYDEKEGSDFQLLHEAVLLESNRIIRENLVKSSVASVLCEAVWQIVKDGLDNEGNKDLYEVLELLLKELRDNNRPYLTLAFFYARLADLLGFSPMVDGCAVCASQKVNSISVADGGFICPDCRLETQSPLVDPEILRQFRYLAKANLDNFHALAMRVTIQKETAEIYRDFIVEHAGMRLKSWAFLEKVL